MVGDDGKRWGAETFSVFLFLGLENLCAEAKIEEAILFTLDS